MVCECSARTSSILSCLFVVFNLYLKGRRTFSDGEVVPACLAHASMYLVKTHSGLSTHRFNAMIDEIIFNDSLRILWIILSTFFEILLTIFLGFFINFLLTLINFFYHWNLIVNRLISTDLFVATINLTILKQILNNVWDALKICSHFCTVSIKRIFYFIFCL